MVDKNEIISNSAKIAEHFKNFFENAVKNLDLPVNDILLNLDVSETDPIDIITEQYASHPSILKIKEKIPSNSNIFSFHEVDQAVIKNEIKNLNSNKATPFGNIPTKDLKRSQEICVPIIQNLFNDSIQTSKCSKNLKLADVSAVFKKDDATNVKNYRPVSVLPVVSKVFERILQNQLLEHF